MIMNNFAETMAFEANLPLNDDDAHWEALHPSPHSRVQYCLNSYTDNRPKRELTPDEFRGLLCLLRDAVSMRGTATDLQNRTCDWIQSLPR